MTDPNTWLVLILAAFALGVYCGAEGRAIYDRIKRIKSE